MTEVQLELLFKELAKLEQNYKNSSYTAMYPSKSAGALEALGKINKKIDKLLGLDDAS